MLCSTSLLQTKKYRLVTIALRNLLLFLVLTLCLMAQATAVRNLEDQVIECGEAPDDFKPCRAIDVIIKSKCNWPAPPRFICTGHADC